MSDQQGLVAEQVERVMRIAGRWADAVMLNDDDPCTESGLACAQTYDALRLQIERELIAARVVALQEALGAEQYQGARSVQAKTRDLIREYTDLLT